MTPRPWHAFYLAGDSYPGQCDIEAALRTRLAPGLHGWTGQSELLGDDRVVLPDTDARVAMLRRFVPGESAAADAVLIGRSSGARTATRLAMEGRAGAVVCLGYPFRRPRSLLEPQRFAHLAAMEVPTLILQGRDDRYGGDDVTEHYRLSAAVRLFILPTDHEFALSAACWDGIAAWILEFLDATRAGGMVALRGFDEAFYLGTHPDVARAVRAGSFVSGEQHFELHGRREGRCFRLLASSPAPR